MRALQLLDLRFYAHFGQVRALQVSDLRFYAHFDQVRALQVLDVRLKRSFWSSEGAAGTRCKIIVLSLVK